MESEEAAADSLKDGNFMSDFTIPQLAEMLEKAKAEKAKTVIPKFELGQKVEWDGYGSDYSGEIIEIDIEIKDDGEPLITYAVDGVGRYWECELELSRK